MNLLISIKEEYFRLIIEGKKKYEFRRKFVLESCNAFIYIPRPICEIQGYIKFSKPIVGTPEVINELALSQNLQEDSDVFEYLTGLAQGFAIPVSKVQTLLSPITLRFLRKKFNFFAPQSYIILDNKPELLEYLKKSL